jgi:hypothetical protein
MKAYWINAADKTVTAVDYNGLPDLQRMVGGYIEIAKVWRLGDVLFVDEEGMFKPRTGWFRVEGNNRPLANNGVVVGPEIGATSKTHPPRLSLERLRREVEFLTDEQVQAWARANSSEANIAFSTLDGTGNIESTEIMQRVGEAFGVSPPKTKG